MSLWKVSQINSCLVLVVRDLSPGTSSPPLRLPKVLTAKVISELLNLGVTPRYDSSKKGGLKRATESRLHGAELRDALLRWRCKTRVGNGWLMISRG